MKRYLAVSENCQKQSAPATVSYTHLDVYKRQQVRVSELSKLLDTTVVTIRSDLDVLEQDGFLERTQGGAIQTVKNFYNLDFQRRKQEHLSLIHIFALT